MKMSFRWYGTGNDSITLSQIRQIPGVSEIVWALHEKQPGEVWETDEIRKVRDELAEYGFGMSVVESVRVRMSPRKSSNSTPTVWRTMLSVNR